MFAPNWSAKADTSIQFRQQDHYLRSVDGRRAVRGREDEHTVKVGCELSLRLGRSGSLALLTASSDEDLTKAGFPAAFRLPALVGYCVNHLARHLQANIPARAFSRVSGARVKPKNNFWTYGTRAPERVIIELPGWWDNGHAYLGVVVVVWWWFRAS